jgi:hypothetical protein
VPTLFPLASFMRTITTSAAADGGSTPMQNHAKTVANKVRTLMGEIIAEAD